MNRQLRLTVMNLYAKLPNGDLIGCIVEFQIAVMDENGVTHMTDVTTLQGKVGMPTDRVNVVPIQPAHYVRALPLHRVT